MTIVFFFFTNHATVDKARAMKNCYYANSRKRIGCETYADFDNARQGAGAARRQKVSKKVRKRRAIWLARATLIMGIENRVINTLVRCGNVISFLVLSDEKSLI